MTAREILIANYGRTVTGKMIRSARKMDQAWRNMKRLESRHSKLPNRWDKWLADFTRLEKKMPQVKI